MIETPRSAETFEWYGGKFIRFESGELDLRSPAAAEIRGLALDHCFPAACGPCWHPDGADDE